MRLTKEVHSNNGKRESLGGTTRTEASLSKTGPILIVKQVIALLTHSPPNSFTSWGEGGVLLVGKSIRREMMCISSFKRESAPLFFGLLLLHFWSFVTFWMVTGKAEDKVSQFLHSIPIVGHRAAFFFSSRGHQTFFSRILHSITSHLPKSLGPYLLSRCPPGEKLP